MTEVLFYLFAAITAGSALALAMSRNVIYAAFLLLTVLLGVAALYVFANAEVLAMSQIIVYVGGTLIIVIFGVMLTSKIKEMRPTTELVNLIPGALLGLALMAMLLFVIKESGVLLANPNNEIATTTNAKMIGQATLTTHLLPFEVVSVLLLVVLLGAAYLSRKTKNQKKEENP